MKQSQESRLNSVMLIFAICTGWLLGCSRELDAADPSEELPFDSIPVQIEAQEATLAGDIFLPENAKLVPGVVIVHGAGKLERRKYHGFVRRLVGLGLAVLLYDKRGVGESTGRYPDVSTKKSNETIPELAADARRAVSVLRSHPEVDSTQVGLFGGSQAGWVIPLAADDNPEVQFLVILSGPAVSVGMEIFHAKLTDEGKKDVSAERIGEEMAAFKGPHGFDPLRILTRLNTPTLWMMGERDRNLPLQETLSVLESLPATGSGVLTLVRFPDADHQMFMPDGKRVDFWKKIKSWLTERGVLEG